jgi:peptidoglycan/LPS O-acetylase OafA/YrhL
MNKIQRYQELDALRGIAAVSIMLYHYTERYTELYGHNENLLFYVPLGYMGVDILFILCGFLTIATLNRHKTAFDYVLARFSRLYPVYFVSVCLTSAATYFIGLPGRTVKPIHALANLSMLHPFFHIPFVDGVYWSLMVQITFYAFIFALRRLPVGKCNIVYALWIAFSLVDKKQSLLGPLGRYLLILDYCHLFIAGIAFYAVYINRKRYDSWAILAATMFTTLLYRNDYREVAASLTIYLCFAAFIYGNLPSFIKCRYMLFMGAISYPLYLIHQNIGYMIMNKLNETGISQWTIPLIAASVSIAIATVLRAGIEVPAMNLLRKSTLYRIRERSMSPKIAP